MKRILFYTTSLLFLFWQISHGNIGKAQGQSNKIVTPMGGIISMSPGTTITQSSPSTVFYSEVIPANTFIPTRWYRLYMTFRLTTPLISIPGLSITFQYGGQTFNLLSSTPLTGGAANQLFTVEFYMIATGMNTQIPFAEIRQPNGTIINLTTASATPVGAFAATGSTDNTLSVSLQFTGVGLGTSSLTNFWLYRDAF